MANNADVIDDSMYADFIVVAVRIEITIIVVVVAAAAAVVELTVNAPSRGFDGEIKNKSIYHISMMAMNGSSD